MRTTIMIATQNNYDRITFSLPNTLNLALDELKSEINRSKSEIIKLAIESYIAQQNKLKLKRAVALMSEEYENDSELTALTTLDTEDFQ
ncbi:MAG TPA: ribbon-helix-helix protein, CopG family [Campylobacterales bacterium]|nr:ribbon-helix-helix protein, CopG family [Campylobacterales bacterium]